MNLRLMRGLRAATLSGLVVLTGAQAAVAQTSDPSKGAISGVVTDRDGNRLENICVHTVDSPVGGEARTNASGEYWIELPPGSYELSYIGCAYDYLFSRLGRRVDVRAGQTSGGADAVLKRSSSVSGRIIDEAGAPVPEMCIYAHPRSGSPTPGLFSTDAETDAEGRFTLRPLSAGSYLINIGDCGRRTDWITPSPNLEIGDEEQRSGVDWSVYHGGRISGTVTDYYGAPKAGVCVYVFGPEGVGRLWGSASSDGSGAYRTGPIARGTYVVRFDGCGSWLEPQPFVPQYYRGTASAAEAEQIVVAGGDSVTGIDARLVDGPTPCVVPDVEGLKLRRARASVSEANCSVGAVRHVGGRGGPGRITRQRPGPDEIRPEDSPVRFVVGPR